MIMINVEEFDDMIMILMILLMIMITLEWPWCLRMVIWCGRPGGGATRFRLWLVLQHIHPSWHFQNAHARYTCVIHLIWVFFVIYVTTHSLSHYHIIITIIIIIIIIIIIFNIIFPLQTIISFLLYPVGTYWEKWTRQAIKEGFFPIDQATNLIVALFLFAIQPLKIWRMSWWSIVEPVFGMQNSSWVIENCQHLIFSASLALALILFWWMQKKTDQKSWE